MQVDGKMWHAIEGSESREYVGDSPPEVEANERRNQNNSILCYKSANGGVAGRQVRRLKTGLKSRNPATFLNFR